MKYAESEPSDSSKTEQIEQNRWQKAVYRMYNEQNASDRLNSAGVSSALRKKPLPRRAESTNPTYVSSFAPGEGVRRYQTLCAGRPPSPANGDQSMFAETGTSSCTHGIRRVPALEENRVNPSWIVQCPTEVRERVERELPGKVSS